MICIVAELNQLCLVCPLIAVLHEVQIIQLSCIDIQFQRQGIRLDVKLQLFDQLSRRTLPSRIVCIDEIADCFKYEGYTGAEIAGMLKKPQSTVRNLLREARIILKERLGNFDEER